MCLHLSFPDHAAAIEMPGAEPGMLAPYQERAKTYPAQFVLHFDPARDSEQALIHCCLTIADTAADSNSDGPGSAT